MKSDGGITKRVIILYVLNILKLYSSPSSPVTQSAMCNFLNEIGIPCSRKTIGRNIQYLIEFGYCIEKKNGKGYYLNNDANSLQKNKFAI